MADMIVVADLVDPDDPHGRTYREVNRANPHAIQIGTLVELESGARLFVVMHTRDCDGTPLYSLAADIEDPDYKWSNGHADDGLAVVSLGPR